MLSSHFNKCNVSVRKRPIIRTGQTPRRAHLKYNGTTEKPTPTLSGPSFLLKAFLSSCMFNPALRSFISAPALFQRKKERIWESQGKNQRLLAWNKVNGSALCLTLCEDANSRLVYQRTVLSSGKISELQVSREQSAGLTSLLESENRAEVYHQT